MSLRAPSLTQVSENHSNRSFNQQTRRAELIFTNFCPLLASYGGGHAQIMAALAKALISRGSSIDLIGFTTARAIFERQGLVCKSVTALLEPEDDTCLRLVEPLLPLDTHPDITQEETHAYFALGLKDLIAQTGETAAIELVRTKGRTAFLPVDSFARYIAKTSPDMVITTTSPRYELALLRAARRNGVTSIAIGDLFLIDEQTWILQPDYAEHLFVLSSHVRLLLQEAGLTGTQIHITGNPVFDQLHDREASRDLRCALRRQIGYEDQRIILWPAAGGAMSMIDRPFLQLEDVVAFLGDFCASHSDTSFLIRPHPNVPITDLALPVSGKLTPANWSIEDCILAADHVAVENSTVGLQAALAGLPVTVVGFGDQVIYPQLGLGDAVESLQGARASLDHYKGPDLSHSAMPPPGQALQTVLKKIGEIRQLG